MHGKLVMVTGANSGIGKVTARELARRGAPVVAVCRDPARGEAAVAEIRRQTGGTIELMVCDFASQRSIRDLADDFRHRHARLDVLVNNAGAILGTRSATEEGHETTFAVNHLGYFLLTNLLLDLVQASAPARIVSVASAGHHRGTMDLADLHFERGYSTTAAYCRSKLANVLFTRELARRTAGSGVTVTCLHPGTVSTGIWDHAPRWAGPILWLPRKLLLSQKQGASTLVHAATDPSVEGVTGVYFERKAPVRPSALALDDGLAARLWAASEAMTGLG